MIVKSYDTTIETRQHNERTDSLVFAARRAKAGWPSPSTRLPLNPPTRRGWARRPGRARPELERFAPPGISLPSKDAVGRHTRLTGLCFVAGISAGGGHAVEAARGGSASAGRPGPSDRRPGASGGSRELLSGLHSSRASDHWVAIFGLNQAREIQITSL